jgi:glycine/D-amino acid oxidase-like deaminating enzyme
VELLDREEVARLVGGGGFHGGLLDRRAGTINPAAYARGLARAALSRGVRISERSPVRAILRAGGRWRLECDAGALLAERVVVCTNAYGGRLWPGLGRNLTIIHYFNLATEPLGERAEEILPEGQGLWDTAPVMCSLRKDAAGRLVIGSMGRLRGGFAAGADRAFHGLSQRFAQARLARLFPRLGRLRFEAAWDGRIAMTPDHLPRIHQLAEGVFAPIGYNGRGITTGTVFGRDLAAFLAGEGDDALPLPLTPPDRDPFRHIKAPLFEAVFLGNQLWQGWR